MSSFGGEDLFGSGPHRFVVGGVSQRHEEHASPGRDGARLTVLGKTGRRIEHRGTLLDDGAAGLEAQRAAIEAAMTGEPRTLVDELGRTWSGVVMLSFEPGRVRRLGQRWAVDYTIEYAQVGEG